MKKLALCILLIIGVFFYSNVSRAQTYQVGHAQITYSDSSRAGRNIQTEIYYPASVAGNNVAVSAGSFPLIIFGHGFVMAWDAYQNIWNDLVPKGYIIAFPRTEGNISPNHAEFGKDLSFLVTKIQNESSATPSSLFYNHVNGKSAVMGHSMGGGSSFLALENNNLITTMISFGAANTNPSSISAAAHISAPTLVFSGENDCVAPAAQHQQPMYDSLGSDCKTFISVKGGAHCEFAEYNFNCSFGQSTCSPQPSISGAAQKDVVSDLMSLWLAYYLKNDCSAIDYFNDSLSVSPRINFAQSCQAFIAPVISQSGSSLNSTIAPNYQWYYNGNIMIGENLQVLNVSLPGNYYVSVVNEFNCPLISNSITVVSNGLNEEDGMYYTEIYPSPVMDILKISFHFRKERKISMRLSNMLGMCMKEKTFYAADEEVGINISDLEKGVYVLEIRSGSAYKTQKIMKQ